VRLRLENQFKDLVGKFLNFFAENDSPNRSKLAEKRFLVIPIDDMDLLRENVLEYTEEIKKFMRISGVIILLNYDIDRYSQTALNYYLAHNEKLKLYSTANSEYEDIRKRVREQLALVSNYMEKVFPLDQRVVLPSLARVLNNCNYKFYHTRNHSDCKDNATIEARNLNELFITAIFHLAHMRLPFDRVSQSYIPVNLRELHNYMKDLFLESTHYVEDNLEKTDDFEKSRNWLANDIIYRWGKDNLTRKQYLFLVEFWDLSDEHKLRFAYQFFLKYESDLSSHKNSGAKCDDYEAYVNATKKDHISFGDLFYLCKYFADRDWVDEGKWKAFNFALLTLFSVRIKRIEYNHRKQVEDNQKTKKKCLEELNNSSGKGLEELKKFIPGEAGYFGFSSLRLFNLSISKSNLDKMENANQEIDTIYADLVSEGYRHIRERLTIPCGRMECFESNIDNCHHNDFTDLANTLDKKDNLEIYIQNDNLEKIIKGYHAEAKNKNGPNVQVTTDVMSKLLGNKPFTKRDELSNIAMISMDQLLKSFFTLSKSKKVISFDVLNPFHKIGSLQYEKEKLAMQIETILQSLNVTQGKTSTITVKDLAETIKERLYNGIIGIPFSDLTFVYSLVNRLEEKFSSSRSNLDESFDTVKTLYDEIIKIFEKEDEKLFSKETTFFDTGSKEIKFEIKGHEIFKSIFEMLKKATLTEKDFFNDCIRRLFIYSKGNECLRIKTDYSLRFMTEKMSITVGNNKVYSVARETDVPLKTIDNMMREIDEEV